MVAAMITRPRADGHGVGFPLLLCWSVISQRFIFHMGMEPIFFLAQNSGNTFSSNVRIDNRFVLPFHVGACAAVVTPPYKSNMRSD